MTKEEILAKLDEMSKEAEKTGDSYYDIDNKTMALKYYAIATAYKKSIALVDQLS